MLKLRGTGGLVLTAAVAMVAVASVSVLARSRAKAKFARLPTVTNFPRGGCHGDVDLARIENGHLLLSGPVDSRIIGDVRHAAAAAWWTTGTEDQLEAADCQQCERQSSDVAAAFAPRFETGHHELAEGAVAQVAHFMSQCPGARVTIQAFADSRWVQAADPQRLRERFGVSYNNELSQRRADTVKALLVGKIPSERIVSATGQGTTDRFTSPLAVRNSGGLGPNRTARITFTFDPLSPVGFQQLAAPAWSQSMFWEYWCLAIAIGSAFGAALSLLVRWAYEISRLVGAPNDDENRLDILEGIGEHFAKAIESTVGIRTLAQLAAATDEQLAKIATLRTDKSLPPIGRATAERWAAMARLIQLPTINKDWAELLVAAGVTSTDILARKNPGTLRHDLVATNVVDVRGGFKTIARWVPTKTDLAYIIKLANDDVRARGLRRRAERRASVARFISRAVEMFEKLRKPGGAIGTPG